MRKISIFDIQKGDTILYHYGNHEHFGDLVFGIVIKLEEKKGQVKLTTLDFWKNGNVDIDYWSYGIHEDVDMLIGKKETYWTKK